MLWPGKRLRKLSPGVDFVIFFHGKRLSAELSQCFPHENYMESGLRKIDHKGVDTMIAVLCDFCQFWANLFYKNRFNDHIFAKTRYSRLSKKTAIIFAKFIGEIIFKMITSAPGPNPCLF
jgi:hypothetical protein